MELEQNVLLSLLQTEIANTSDALPDLAWDWNALAAEARAQSVLLTVFGAVSKIKQSIPQDIFEKQFSRCYAMLAANTRVSVGQKRLVELLERNHYPYVILKGEAAAYYYPKPELRILGDVDFLIDSKDEDEITALLKEDGFVVSHETDTHHRVFSKPGIRLEMHFEVAGMPTGAVGEKVRGFMANALSDFQYADIGVGKFKMPSAMHHGLILLLHMQHHMLDVGIGLRHLCDWACFVKETVDQPFWEETFLPLLKEIGLFRYAAVMTKTCANYLGIVCPAWALEIEDALGSGIMEDIIAGGNFGRKDELRKGSGVLIPQNEKGKNAKNKVHALYLTMKRSVLTQHPQARKNAVLYGCCFLYRTVRYGLMLLFGKRVSILQSVGQANERKELYDQLHIFEVDET